MPRHGGLLITRRQRQDAGEVAGELDLEPAILRDQPDLLDDGAQRRRRLGAQLIVVQLGLQVLDLGAVELRQLGVQARRERRWRDCVECPFLLRERRWTRTLRRVAFETSAIVSAIWGDRSGGVDLRQRGFDEDVRHPKSNALDLTIAGTPNVAEHNIRLDTINNR